jgi:hypothetical protein
VVSLSNHRSGRVSQVWQAEPACENFPAIAHHFFALSRKFFRHGSIPGGSLKRSLGMAKL